MFQKGFQKCARHGPTLPKPTEIRSELILAHAYLSVILRSPLGGGSSSVLFYNPAVSAGEGDLARFFSIFAHATAATSHFARPFASQSLLRSAPHVGNARLGRLPIFDFSTPRIFFQQNYPIEKRKIDFPPQQQFRFCFSFCGRSWSKNFRDRLL